MTSTKRAHIVLPEDLVQEIDKIAGSRVGVHFWQTSPSARSNGSNCWRSSRAKSQSGRTKITWSSRAELRLGCARRALKARPVSRRSKSNAIPNNGDLPSRHVRHHRCSQSEAGALGNAGVHGCSRRHAGLFRGDAHRDFCGRSTKEIPLTERFLDALEHYPLDSQLARAAGLLKNEWGKKGRTMGVVDMIIAATALAHNLVLMTDNRKDFPMTELALYPLP